MNTAIWPAAGRTIKFVDITAILVERDAPGHASAIRKNQDVFGHRSPSVPLSGSVPFPVALVVSGAAIIKPLEPILADIIALSGARISELYAIATYRISRKLT